jgi:uncharacterized protein (DUF362 family)
MIAMIEQPNVLRTTINEFVRNKLGKEDLKNKRTLLKPNMGYPKPAPFTTSLEVIKNVVEALSELRAQEIIIAEGSTSKSSALVNYQKTGLIEALEDIDVTFMDLNAMESKAVKVRQTIHYLPKILREVDYRLSLPVIKLYNDDTGEIFLSNAIKNFFGLPPKKEYQLKHNSPMRDSLHNDLHQSVVEIYEAVQQFAPFDLFICDGTTILEGFADEGRTKALGKIIISNDAFEVDMFVLNYLQKPMPRYLKELQKKKENSD